MLQVDHVHFEVKDRVLLSQVAFQAYPGEVIGIVGPNGAGKSTLLRMISGEYQVHRGSISWKEAPLDSYKSGDIAKERAVLTQKIQMAYDFPVKEVVLMGRYPHFSHNPRSEDWMAVETSMKRVEADTLGDRPYQVLSGGEQQRVQLARAFAQLEQMGGPFLMMLDEPLNNLDIRYQFNLLEQVHAFARKGHVVLIVMHDLVLAGKFCDQLLLLKKGRSLAFGTPASVLTDRLLTEAYDFPVKVIPDPFGEGVMLHFGTIKQDKQDLSIPNPLTYSE